LNIQMMNHPAIHSRRIAAMRASRTVRLQLPVAALLLLCLFTPGPTAAQETARVSAGDVLRIEVGTRTDLTGQYTVAESGTITIPRIGSIRAEGKTTADLEEDISRRLSLVDRDIPKVTVTIVESRTRRVFVLGAVLVPGSYSFTTPPTAWDAITLAGGPEDDADLTAVEVIPTAADAGRTTTTVDLSAALKEGRLAEAPRLRAGDTVRVPRKGVGIAGAGNQVYVFGAASVQGAIPLEQAPDLMTAVLKAGGGTAGSDLRKIQIVRHDGKRLVSLRVNLEEYVSRADPGGNIALRAGDEIRIPARTPKTAAFTTAMSIVGPLLGLLGTIIALSSTRD
jgi:polysaccharide export outer membrane protein